MRVRPNALDFSVCLFYGIFYPAFFVLFIKHVLLYVERGFNYFKNTKNCFLLLTIFGDILWTI